MSTPNSRSRLSCVLVLTCCAPIVSATQVIDGAATTICRLLDTPSKWEGATVRLRARYWIDPYHGAFLVDETCRGKTMDLEYTLEGAHRSVRRFADAAINPLPTLWDIEITGSIERVPPIGDVQSNVAPEPKLQIRLTRVWSFSQWPIERRSPPNTSLDRPRDR